ncbi:class A beta-lactamase [Phenylobacterium aquaticum]|uniref:class A beta-lactamase n=1 Tax=Phenylobacterium aquaticum TaxID=1763816 RepID=UPI0026F2A1D0|nr:class A beta-lactamase [Phenylobacterium aquaticum]
MSTRRALSFGRMLPRLVVASGLLSLVLLIPVAKTEPEQKVDGRVVRQAAAALAAPDLSARIADLGEGFDGRVGISVRDLTEGWTTNFDGDTAYPQQSVSKLWVALAALDAVDRGRLALEDTVTIRPENLSVFHQPIRARVVSAGAYAATIRQLLAGAISQSDNTANDVLLSTVGGRAVVQAAVNARGLAGITASPSERDMQTETAGLEWRREYSFEHSFWNDRDKLPLEFRRVSLDEYLAHPPDAATPNGMVNALDRLHAGKLLGPRSTQLLLQLMFEAETGPSRLKAGLPPGWTLAHKTGTGQVLGPVATGFNDVGVITAPDGHAYAVAVMIAQTRTSIETRQDVMVAVARAIVAHHDRELASQAGT